MKNVIILLFIAMSILSIALIPKFKKSAVNDTKSATALPDLLLRNPNLGSAEEIEWTMTTYDNLSDNLEANPEDAGSKLQLAALYMQEARITGEHGHYYPAALTMIESALGQEALKEDLQFQALSLKAAVLLSLHQFQNALPVIEQAIALNGHNARIYGALVDVHVELGNYDKAVEAADKMMSIRPDLRSYSRVSYLRELHGDVEGAKVAMDYAVKAAYPGYEESAWCMLNLGQLYERSGELEKAASIYQSILSERASYPFAIAAMGRVKMKQGNMEEAEQLAKQACEIIPEFTFYELLASIYRKTGKDQSAKKLLDEVIEGFEEDEAAGHDMSIEYAKLYLHHLNEPDKALKHARKEHKYRPQNITVNKTMAEIFYRKGNYSKAASHLEKAMATGINDAELMLLSGLIKAKTGQIEAGRTEVKAAFEVDPHMMVVYAEEGKKLMNG